MKKGRLHFEKQYLVCPSWESVKTIRPLQEAQNYFTNPSVEPLIDHLSQNGPTPRTDLILEKSSMFILPQPESRSVPSASQTQTRIRMEIGPLPGEGTC